jgi:hypothetical protein
MLTERQRSAVWVGMLTERQRSAVWVGMLTERQRSAVSQGHVPTGLSALEWPIPGHVTRDTVQLW